MKRIPLYENLETKEIIYQNASGSTELELKEGLSTKEGILGVVKAKTFFPDGYSRNGRFYPKKLWENAVNNPETQNMIKRGLMFGCIGHPENYSLDELLSSGAVSHKITKVWTEKGIGWTEAEILDTPAGRIMNAVLKSGSKPYVSTRAFGSFKEEKIKNPNTGQEVPIVNPDDFIVESFWDMVLNPGFLETEVNLKENLKKELKEDIDKLQHSGIKCKDGLCELNDTINELKYLDDYDTKDTSKTENKDKNHKNYDNEYNKDFLLAIIEDLKQQNDYLLNQKDNEFNNIEDENEMLSYINDFIMDIIANNKKYKDQFNKLYQMSNTEINKDELLKIIDSIDFEEVKELKNILKTEELHKNILTKNIIKMATKNIKLNSFYEKKLNSINNSIIELKEKLNIKDNLLIKTLNKLEEYKNKPKIKNEGKENKKEFILLEKELQYKNNIIEKLKNKLNKIEEINKEQYLKLEELENKKEYFNKTFNKDIIKLKEKLNNKVNEINELLERNKQLQETNKELENKLKETLNKSNGQNLIKDNIIEDNIKVIKSLKEALNKLNITYNEIIEDKKQLKEQNLIKEDIIEELNNKINKLKETNKELVNNQDLIKKNIIEEFNNKLNSELNNKIVLQEENKELVNKLEEIKLELKEKDNTILELKEKSLVNINESSKNKIKELEIKYLQEKYKKTKDEILKVYKNNLQETEELLKKDSIIVQEIIEKKKENNISERLERISL